MSKKHNNVAVVHAYESMLLIRRFEEKTGQLYGMGLVGGFCHLYIGQEAVAVGIQENLIEGDSVITSYRDHGIMLATGSAPNAVMAELLGKETGCSKGKGGSMHMFDIPKGFYGGHGIVGAQVPIGTGIAFANQYKKNDNICVTYFGDGAANQGQVYESFNMAKLWNLPVLYIIENNEYAMGTSTTRGSSNANFYKRGEAFGVSGKQIDGMDYFKVFDGVSEAVHHIRKNKEPLLLEMKTYRYRGHSMSDPGQYRDKNEIAQYKDNKDPIDRVKRYIINNKINTETQLKEIDKKVREIVNEAVEFAKNSTEPNTNELFTDIYNEVS